MPTPTKTRPLGRMRTTAEEGRAAGAVVGGGHAVADELVAFAMLAGLCGAFGPAEAVGGLGVALAQMFAGPRVALARIFFGVVDEAKLDGVDVEFFGEFVEGDLEADAAGGFAGGAHPGAHAEVEVDHVVAGGERFAVVEECGLAGGALDPVRDERGVAGGVVLLEEELAVGGGGEFDVLVGVGARAYGAEHLLAAEDEFDGALGDFCGHGGEDGVGPDVAFAAEASAGVRTLDVDVGGRNGEGAGERSLNAADALGGVVDGELVAVPPDQEAMVACGSMGLWFWIGVE